MNNIPWFGLTELQESRNNVFKLITLLKPIFQQANGGQFEFYDIFSESYDENDLESVELLDILTNIFFQRNASIYISNIVPLIPEDELERLREFIVNMKLLSVKYIQAYERQDISRSAYGDYLDAKTQFLESVYNFIKFVYDDTRFLRGIYERTNNRGIEQQNVQNYSNYPNYANFNNYLTNERIEELNRQLDARNMAARNRTRNTNIRLFNKLNKETPNTNLNINSRAYNTLNGLNTNKCVDAVMYNEKNIDETSTKLYIVDSNNRIIRVFCIDEDGYQQYFKKSDNVVYKCKSTVPMSALFINTESIIQKPIRRLAFDFNVYVYEKQAKKIQKGKSYILQPTDEPVGRIASHSVVSGGNLIGALHCQPVVGNDVIYSIKEYNATTGGKTRKASKVRKMRKTRAGRK